MLHNSWRRRTQNLNHVHHVGLGGRQLQLVGNPTPAAAAATGHVLQGQRRAECDRRRPGLGLGRRHDHHVVVHYDDRQRHEREQLVVGRSHAQSDTRLGRVVFVLVDGVERPRRSQGPHRAHQGRQQPRDPHGRELQARASLPVRPLGHVDRLLQGKSARPGDRHADAARSARAHTVPVCRVRALCRVDHQEAGGQVPRVAGQRALQARRGRVLHGRSLLAGGRVRSRSAAHDRDGRVSEESHRHPHDAEEHRPHELRRVHAHAARDHGRPAPRLGQPAQRHSQGVRLLPRQLVHDCGRGAASTHEESKR